VLKDLREFQSARERFEQSLSIHRHLAQREPQVRETSVASSLSNLGAVLMELREFDSARVQFEESLALYRHLAQHEPRVYEPYVARALHSLDIVLMKLQEYKSARAANQEAIALGEKHRLWLENAGTHFHLGMPEEAEGNIVRTLEQFEACVERCERGLSQISERMPLGEALLETRREMAKAHHNTPLVWATTVLWGNPWARLV
jgi:tetratricopeptide (TPR) repeat protein